MKTVKRTIPALSLLTILVLLVGLYFVIHKSSDSTTLPKLHSTSSSAPKSNTTAVFIKSKYSLNDPSSLWVVVNKWRPLNPISYIPGDLVSVGNGQRMRSAAAKALGLMIKAASENGLKISALSGYRSYTTQVSVYTNEVKNYGQTIADSESARPGYSEHQTGWAVDIGGGGCGIENCFANTPEGKWVAANAYKYGFIIRYTAAKQVITGYRAEPWHIRYIGVELASQMHKTDITTLEEFFKL